MPKSDGGAVRRLVIVESPAKAKKIAGYLGAGYDVEASVGHIRDIPERASDIPAEFKAEPWSRLGVDVENDFQPIYVVSPKSKSTVAELKRLLKGADELLLATDEDREGEAIAWHLLELLKPKVPVRRMVFNEITKDAILEAAENTRDLDYDLVAAQEARRILDRLYGYEVSPVLWRKFTQGLSAGRVQSVALWLCVDRERERMAFVRAGYHSLDAVVAPGDFPSALHELDGARVATGADFGPDGQLKARRQDAVLLDASTAGALAGALRGQSVTVTGVEQRPKSLSPKPPFRTATLQQAAASRLRWSVSQTMSVAQALYENGHITYMRTDSTALSNTAIAAARRQAEQLYGADYVHPSPRVYARQTANAQEAHEAIRPAGEDFRTPAQLAGKLTGDQFRLYELIWQRTVASQMANAQQSTTTISLVADLPEGLGYERAGFRSTGTVLVFPGWKAAYDDTGDDSSTDAPARLPSVTEGQSLTLTQVDAVGHETSPPARYTEGTLVKALEQRGIGRPSTYQSIIGKLRDRDYLRKSGSALIPTWLGMAVVRMLEQQFTELIDVDFTAKMEDTLDAIARGEADRTDVLTGFYFGGQGIGSDDFPGLKPLIEPAMDADARALSAFPIAGTSAILRVGRYGPYLDVDSERLNVPEDVAPADLTAEVVAQLMAAPSGERELGEDPNTGRMLVAKSGRYGPYVTEVLPTEDEAPETAGTGADGGADEAKAAAPKRTKKSKAKPRTASLFKSMSLDTVTLDDALMLLSLPRVVGAHPESGEPVMAQNGRYGPYLSCAGETRTLPTEDAILSITLPESLELLAQPKYGGRRAATPGRPLGTDPETGNEIQVKSGRFGPYVTDGEYNATLRGDDTPENVSLERAAALLAARRAAGPPKKRGRKAAKKTTTKKTARKTSKKPAAKKAAKKATAKKATKKTSAAPRKSTAPQATSARRIEVEPESAATGSAGTQG